MNLIKRFHRWNGARLLKKIQKVSFLSIDDLPIYNWWQVHKTKDKSYILKNRRTLKKWETVAMKSIWDSLVNQYLEAFGINETYKEIIEIEKDILYLRTSAIAIGETPDRTLIEIREKDIADRLQAMGDRQQDSYYEHKGMMEHLLGFSIDIHKCSVKEYYSYKPVIESIMEKKQNEVIVL